MNFVGDEALVAREHQAVAQSLAPVEETRAKAVLVREAERGAKGQREAHPLDRAAPDEGIAGKERAQGCAVPPPCLLYTSRCV